MNFIHDNQPDTPQQAGKSPSSDVPPTQTHTPHQPTNAGLVVLQWLTYAFWGWTVFGLSILTSTVLASFINDADVGEFTPYGIAAVLVLLPISFICDTLYSKREPTHKTGPETLVMVTHAVLFALFGIGSLIFGVFSLVQILVGSTDASYTITALLSSLIVAAYYGLTFLRTLNPVKAPWIKRFYKLFMLVTVGVIIVLGIVGPVAKERSLRDDRLIEAELPSLQQGIQSYASTNKKLPENLNALTVNDGAKKLIDRNIVTYKPNTKAPTAPVPGANIPIDLPLTLSSPAEPAIYKPAPDNASQTTVFHYQLCVTFKKAANNYEDAKRSSYDDDGDGYSNYLDVYAHPAGNICYKLNTENYY